MPTPSTSHLPRPKSWDEFEDMCADLLRKLWADPYVVRNGRSGQPQDGVDIHGIPKHLGAGRFSGAQCKCVEVLSFGDVKAEVSKAQNFEPRLSEYLVLTTAPRDGKLQKEVSTGKWPFQVRVMFWEDLSLALSGHDDLLQKHFAGWLKKATSKGSVLETIEWAEPEDFDYSDADGVFVYTKDVALTIQLDRTEIADRPFDEPWVRVFPDPEATRQPVYICYGSTRVRELLFVYVDGGRHLLPLPKSHSNLTITQFQFKLGRILNPGKRVIGFQEALQRSGIVVEGEPPS